MAKEGKNRSRPQTGGGGLAPSVPSSQSKATKGRSTQAIPPAVANRMARRVAIATGLPTLMGMGSFIGSYVVVSRGLLDIPPVATLVTSGGFFLLGLVGLSYGVLSASWETSAGSLLGFEQVGVNINRLRNSVKRPPASS
ncbi:photosystem II biosynthesis protein [Synechococcus sp. W4D4]|uniref:photosystem II biosynthesis protein n=1 Tax=Synechococcus sp. W4D4 TaxID=3392294 RepID=UPI0039E9243E